MSYSRPTQRTWPSWSSRCPRTSPPSSWTPWSSRCTTTPPTSGRSTCCSSSSRQLCRRRSSECRPLLVALNNGALLLCQGCSGPVWLPINSPSGVSRAGKRIRPLCQCTGLKISQLDGGTGEGCCGVEAGISHIVVHGVLVSVLQNVRSHWLVLHLDSIHSHSGGDLLLMWSIYLYFLSSFSQIEYSPFLRTGRLWA